MQLLDLTLPSVGENLALDEALLEAAEAGELTGEVLRLWESPQTAVVLGRASRWQDESCVAACRDDLIEVVRRASAGDPDAQRFEPRGVGPPRQNRSDLHRRHRAR